jgi:hypothetical protein
MRVTFEVPKFAVHRLVPSNTMLSGLEASAGRATFVPTPVRGSILVRFAVESLLVHTLVPSKTAANGKIAPDGRGKFAATTVGLAAAVVVTAAAEDSARSASVTGDGDDDVTEDGAMVAVPTELDPLVVDAVAALDGPTDDGVADEQPTTSIAVIATEVVVARRTAGAPYGRQALRSTTGDVVSR